MLEIALPLAFGLIGLAMLLTLYRLLRGPSLPDRALALDTLYINTVALIVLYGIASGDTLYFQAALLIALIGFVSTVALARYMLRGPIIEQTAGDVRSNNARSINGENDERHG